MVGSTHVKCEWLIVWLSETSDCQGDIFLAGNYIILFYLIRDAKSDVQCDRADAIFSQTKWLVRWVFLQVSIWELMLRFPLFPFFFPGTVFLLRYYNFWQSFNFEKLLLAWSETWDIKSKPPNKILYQTQMHCTYYFLVQYSRVLDTGKST